MKRRKYREIFGLNLKNYRGKYVIKEVFEIMGQDVVIVGQGSTPDLAFTSFLNELDDQGLTKIAMLLLELAEDNGFKTNF